MTVGLDTSVVLRLLVGEPVAQAELAWRTLDTADEPVLLSDLVVGEAYFALRHHYRVPHGDAIRSLQGLVTDPRVRTTGVARAVLADVAEHDTDPGLMDRLIVADAARDGAVLLTFDRAAARLAGARLLTA